MPISTVFSNSNFHDSTIQILREHLVDYLPGSDHVVTFEQPSTAGMKKAIIWLTAFDSRNLDRLRTRRGGKSLQRKELSFGILVISAPGIANIPKGAHTKLREICAKIEHDAILRDGYKLRDAGLHHAHITPFTDIVTESEQVLFKRYAVLTVDVYVEAT